MGGTPGSAPSHTSSWLPAKCPHLHTSLTCLALLNCLPSPHPSTPPLTCICLPSPAFLPLIFYLLLLVYISLPFYLPSPVCHASPLTVYLPSRVYLPLFAYLSCPSYFPYMSTSFHLPASPYLPISLHLPTSPPLPFVYVTSPWDWVPMPYSLSSSLMPSSDTPSTHTSGTFCWFSRDCRLPPRNIASVSLLKTARVTYCASFLSEASTLSHPWGYSVDARTQQHSV